MKEEKRRIEKNKNPKNVTGATKTPESNGVYKTSSEQKNSTFNIL